jgi:hypothetical protein
MLGGWLGWWLVWVVKLLQVLWLAGGAVGDDE